MKGFVIARNQRVRAKRGPGSLAITVQMDLVRIEKDAGDDEHCRHRQHVRECFRGRPLGGFLHAGLSLNLGATHRGAANAHDRQNFYSEHPATSGTRLSVSPHSANIDGVKVDQQ